MSTPCEEIRPELEELLGAMAEGRLDAAGAKRLSRILNEHPDARQFYLDYCQMHALLQSAHGVLQAMEDPAVGRRRILAWTAAAAAVLVAAGTLFFLRSSGPIDATASVQRGAPVLLRGDRKLPLTDLRAGDRIVTPAEASTEVRFGDGSRIVLSEKTEVRLRDDGAARVELREGALRCEVTSQSATRPFAVRTPHAEAVVLGTSFDLAASSDETRLSTHSGRVRLATENAGVDVGPGERASATSAGIVRWVPVRDHDFSAMKDLPSTMETVFCESSIHLTKDRRVEPAPGRVRLVPGGLTFDQSKHGLVVFREKEAVGEDVVLEADVAGGKPWSLGFSVSGDSFEGYRVIFAALDEYPNGVAVDTISSKELMVLARDPRKILYDRDCTLRVERRGVRIRVWVDDQLRIDTEVTQALPEGRRRTVSLSNFGDPAVVKRFRVWKPS